jgi:predicted transcriptional regulator
MKTDNGNKTDSGANERRRTLHVRFKRSDTDTVEATLSELDQGETPDPYFEVVFHDPAQLHQVTRPKNLELLQAITQNSPESIRETARLVERDVRQVHRNLTELESLGLITIESSGQAKRPSVWYDAIEVDLPLDSTDSSQTGARA